MEYNEAILKIEKLFELTTFAVLATANKNGVVSASQMCLINDGLTLFFQTDKTFEKIRNITENPNVAINLGPYYFKGTAEIIGKPTDFPEFIEKIKKKHLQTYEHYSNLPHEVLIRVDLTECKIWGVDASKDIHSQKTIQVLNLKGKKSSFIVCDKM